MQVEPEIDDFAGNDPLSGCIIVTLLHSVQHSQLSQCSFLSRVTAAWIVS